MTRTATVRARMRPELKTEVEEVFDRLGVTTSEAITMFFSQVKMRKGLPFAVEVPNETTRRTFEATDRGEGLHDYRNLDDMFKALER